MSTADELRDAGVPLEPGVTQSGAFIEALKLLGYGFRLNLASQAVEVNGQPLSDIAAAIIRRDMRDRGVKNMAAVEDAYLAEAQRNAYHPVKDYLARLVWDGCDHISAWASKMESDSGVVDYHDGEPPVPLHAVYLYRWAIGAVAKIMQGAQNPMLVWDGSQGLGKSLLAERLCPLPDFFLEGPINVQDKDSDVRLMSKWIWEVSELDATTRKSDVSALKAFITKGKVTVRKAYGRNDVSGHAMASFIGTVNNSTGFLTDETGSRRFYIVKLTKIDWGYRDLDVDQFWAQAMHLYLHNEPHALQPEEVAAQQAVNAQYEIETPLEDWMLQHFTITGEETDRLTMGEIINHLRLKDIQLHGSERAQAMELARVLIRLGVVHGLRRLGGKPSRVWIGIVVSHAA